MRLNTAPFKNGDRCVICRRPVLDKEESLKIIDGIFKSEKGKIKPK
jgi:hypothetical protein